MKPRDKQKNRVPQVSRLRPGISSSATIQLVNIEKPVYGGSFLARVDGKAVFVPMTLPGEQARVRITEDKDKRGYAKAEVDELITAAPERIKPRCPHFGPCGGCNYQHTGYENQLAFKKEILRETLERAGVDAPDEIGVLAADPWQYRNRIRVGFDADGRPGYRARRSHDLIASRECPITAPLLVRAAISAGEILARVPHNLRPHEVLLFCSADESQMLATFFVKEGSQLRLDPIAAALYERVPQLEGAELASGGRPGHPPRTLARWGEPSILYRASGVDYRVDHGAFFQVNRWLIDRMVQHTVGNQSGALAWDLFAGVGLFARQLTKSFEKVAAVESAPTSTQALAANLAGTVGEAIPASTLDFLRHHATGPRPDLIVVDPPRTGLGEEINRLLATIAAPRIAYVSCDPATLARDLRALTAAGYSLENVTMTDLFPQTAAVLPRPRLRVRLASPCSTRHGCSLRAS
jgi:23S rRNA (uracil1939-C5)-methyltransferase